MRNLPSDTVSETPTIGHYDVVGIFRLSTESGCRSRLHVQQVLNFDDRRSLGDTGVYDLEHASRTRREVHSEGVRIRSCHRFAIEHI